MGTVTIDARGQAARESRAIAFFGTWTIIGLFVDGWAHQANKPETFFTPWHGLLYSGFTAAVLWFAFEGRRAPGGQTAKGIAADKLMTIGLVGFIVAAIGDGLWHEIFGVEVDLEALLSPTHLLLMTGGLLMLSGPIRWALADDETDVPSTPTFVEYLPLLVALTLCASLATFFTMYLGAHEPVARADDGELGEAVGVASVLARNLLVLAPLLFARRYWTLPMGACTFLLGINALLMAALEGFDFPQLILPFVLGGVVADIIGARRTTPTWVFALAVPFVIWASYFAIHEMAWGIVWTVELWTGAIFLAMVLTYGIDALLTPRERQRQR